MRLYSAVQAIGPAWDHTRALLWQDRNKKRFLKICLVAIGAELGGINANFGRFGNHGNAPIPPALAAVLATFSIVFGLLFFLIGLVLFYFSSRLQFVLFDIVLLRDDRVAPSWRRHGSHTWRWIAVKITAAVGTAILLSPLLVPILIAVIALAHTVSAPTVVHGSPRVSLSALRPFLLMALEALAAAVAYVAVFRFFTTLALPGLALEDLPYGATFQRAWQIFRFDVPAMLLFSLVQPLFLMLLGIAGLVCIALAVLIAAVPFAAVGGLLWLLLHKSGMFAAVLIGLFAALALLLLALWGVLCELVVVGALYTFARAWSLYFLGGRYPLLGQYLEPSPAVPVWTPPPSLPPDDEDDDAGGPTFPADPVLA